VRTWVERFPERFEYELGEFADRGLKFELDSRLLSEQGRVVLRGELSHRGAEIGLEVHYPDLFPYLRPEVVASELSLPRHQNPFARNLCLLDRSTRAWNPSDTGAWLVGVRVPHLLDLLAGSEAALREAEVAQGEPVSAYFGGIPGAAIFVPEEVLALAETARAGSGRIACSLAEPPRLRLRGLVAELVEKKRNKKTRMLARADADLAARFGGKTISFRWARLEELPSESSPNAVLAAINNAHPGFGSPPWQAVQDGEIAISAAVIAEEVEQGQYEDGWIFAAKGRQGTREFGYLIRGERLARSDLAARSPLAGELGEKRVSLLGLGASGAELAIELARAGVGQIRGMDFDHVEAGTIVRWPIGLTAVGHQKTEAIKARILLDYPFTAFEAFSHQLGQSASMATARSESELDLLDRFLEDTNLVIEASAEIGIQQAISAIADERGLPQLYVWGTEGARGGLVAHVRPGITGCWMCLQYHLEEETIPLPAREQTPHLQPRGCAALTYSGSGFDLAPTVAQAARVATAALAGKEATEMDRGDVFVCSFEEDPFAPPRWSTHALEPHPRCDTCAARSS
jgi:hypothetical protein